MALARRTSAKKSTSLSASSFAVVSPGASLASSDMSQTMRSFDIDARPSTNRVARASAAMGVSESRRWCDVSVMRSRRRAQRHRYARASRLRPRARGETRARCFVRSLARARARDGVVSRDGIVDRRVRDNPLARALELERGRGRRRRRLDADAGGEGGRGGDA